MEVLKVERANKNFGGVVAVKDFDLSVRKGQIVGIIGPNGAGKTTIFNLISKIYPLDSGKIYVSGEDVSDFQQEFMAAAGIARTFQNIRLFSGLNVLNNVKVGYDYLPSYGIIESIFMLPRRIKEEKRIEKEAMEYLELVGLSHVWDEQPGNLPYGMQRKLEIARALSLKPKVLLLDEPAAGLNLEEALNLVDFLRETLDKLEISLLIIEHRMDVIMELCDSIYVQDFGSTIAVGTPEEIQSNPVVLAAYLGEDIEHAGN